MKKVLFTLLLAAVISFSASAQETRVGGLLAIGTDSDFGNFGIGGIAEFLFNDKMAVSPSLIFFFPKDENDVKLSMWELNANFNYYFYQENSISLYGLAGLNIANYKIKWDYDVPGDDTESDTEVGLNLGIGSNFSVSNEKILPFAELKYEINEYDQLVILAGVKFNIK